MISMTQHKAHIDDSVIISCLNHLDNLVRVKNHYSALIMAGCHQSKHLLPYLLRCLRAAGRPDSSSLRTYFLVPMQ